MQANGKKISSVLAKRAYLKYSQDFDLCCRYSFPAFVITAFRAQMVGDDQNMALRAFDQLGRFDFHVYSPPLPSPLFRSFPFWYSHNLHLLQIRSRMLEVGGSKYILILLLTWSTSYSVMIIYRFFSIILLIRSALDQHPLQHTRSGFR